MRWPSGESKTTEQKSPVARDMCSATILSSASISGTASLKASAAAPIAPRRPESSAIAGGPDSPLDTMQLYSGVLVKLLLYVPNRAQTEKARISYADTTSTLKPIVQSDSLNV